MTDCLESPLECAQNNKEHLICKLPPGPLATALSKAIYEQAAELREFVCLLAKM